MRSKDIAVGYALGYNDGLGQGGSIITDKWVRPSDWPALPEPADNQVVILITTQWGASPYQQIRFFAYKQGDTATYFDGTTSAFVDWGDGYNETIELPSTRQISSSTQHNFLDFDDSGNFVGWHDGPVLDNGAHVFVITVTIPDNAYFYFDSSNCNPLEIYIGKSVKFRNSILQNEEMLEHVKFFGWQPSDDNHYATSGTGLFQQCYALQCVDATETLSYIPAYAFWNCYSLKEIDLSACAEIKDYGLYSTAIKEVSSEALQILNEYSLGDCYALTSINAPNLSTITSNYALQSDFNITDITIAEDCSYPTGTFAYQYKWYDNPEKEHPPV